jgi:hypothetical protein
MALTPLILAPQGAVLATIRATAQEIRAPQGAVLAAINFPAEAVKASFGGVQVTYRQTAQTIDVSQGAVLAVVRGRVFDPKVRAWTFTLDGHDFYVLKLGNDGTIVYDVLAQQWYEWGSGEERLWRAYYGNNWLGGRKFADEYGSNIIVGDDSNGALYFLDPLGNVDDDASAGVLLPRPFLREIIGQIPMRGYDMKSCYGVSLMGAIGETNDVTLTAITLSTSDDDGHSYDKHETLNVDPGDWQARVDWNSGLGSFQAPGRLFLVQDRGALQRIDWLDMATDED